MHRVRAGHDVSTALTDALAARDTVDVGGLRDHPTLWSDLLNEWACWAVTADPEVRLRVAVTHAVHLVDAGSADAAEARLERALRGPHAPGAGRDAANVVLASAALAAGRPAAALDALVKLSEGARSSRRATVLRAAALIELGHRADAAAALGHLEHEAAKCPTELEAFAELARSGHLIPPRHLLDAWARGEVKAARCQARGAMARAASLVASALPPDRALTLHAEAIVTLRGMLPSGAQPVPRDPRELLALSELAICVAGLAEAHALMGDVSAAADTRTEAHRWYQLSTATKNAQLTSITSDGPDRSLVTLRALRALARACAAAGESDPARVAHQLGALQRAMRAAHGLSLTTRTCGAPSPARRDLLLLDLWRACALLNAGSIAEGLASVSEVEIEATTHTDAEIAAALRRCRTAEIARSC